MSVAEILDDPGEAPPEAEAFYAESLRLLTESGIPFLLSGTYALTAYTGITRPTKDLDVFCKAGDYPKILAFFQERGYRTGVEDERWIAKVWKGEHFFDVIYNMSNATVPITDEWFDGAPSIEVFGCQAKITPPTEFIWSKVFIQDRSVGRVAAREGGRRGRIVAVARHHPVAPPKLQTWLFYGQWGHHLFVRDCNG